jgi:chemotaxis protein methyltransferase CheR
MRLRWVGYRKVRRQVCRRIARRVADLGLADLEAYAEHLREHTEEWDRLRNLCRVTISRFYRDRGVFDFIAGRVLPELANEGRKNGVRCWSAGCASGEEPYTLTLAWRLAVQRPEIRFSVVATDADAHLLERARRGVYEASSLKDLPHAWKDDGFEAEGDRSRVRDEFREAVEFRQGDLREELPDGPFSLVLCRNLVLTYFDRDLQREVLSGVLDRLTTGGALVVGIHETPPGEQTELVPWNERLGVWRLSPDGSDRSPASP